MFGSQIKGDEHLNYVKWLVPRNFWTHNHFLEEPHWRLLLRCSVAGKVRTFRPKTCIPKIGGNTGFFNHRMLVGISFKSTWFYIEFHRISLQKIAMHIFCFWLWGFALALLISNGIEITWAHRMWSVQVSNAKSLACYPEISISSKFSALNISKVRIYVLNLLFFHPAGTFSIPLLYMYSPNLQSKALVVQFLHDLRDNFNTWHLNLCLLHLSQTGNDRHRSWIARDRIREVSQSILLYLHEVSHVRRNVVQKKAKQHEHGGVIYSMSISLCFGILLGINNQVHLGYSLCHDLGRKMCSTWALLAPNNHGQWMWRGGSHPGSKRSTPRKESQSKPSLDGFHRNALFRKPPKISILLPPGLK